jgi:phage portal protein BeeE
VGILSWLLGTDSTADIAEAVTPPYPSVTDLVNAYVAARMAGAPFVNPALERGVELIASAVAQLAPVVYRDGQAMEDQPRIVSRPDPWSTRYDFLHQTTRSMVEEGDAHWFLFDHDPDTNRPRAARVVPVGEVEVGWDELHFLPTYRWRGKLMRHGSDWRHIRLAPRAGELLGRSPVKACARALLGIEAAELYAAGYFGGSGAVSGVLQFPASWRTARPTS